MDNQRLFLWIALAFVAFLNWQAWQIDYGPQPVPPATGDASVTAPAEVKVMPSKVTFPLSVVPVPANGSSAQPGWGSGFTSLHS